MTIDGESDINTCNLSGTIKWTPKFTTNKGYTFLKFTICSETVRQGEVKHWEYSTVQMMGDEAVAWDQKGTLQAGVYVYATNLVKRGGDPYESAGKWRSGDVFEYSRRWNKSTLIVDHDHESNAGLVAEPINAETGKPAAPVVEEDNEGGRPMPSRAASGPVRAPMAPRAPARVAPRVSAVPTRSANPVTATPEVVVAPVVAPTVAPSRMAAAAKSRTPTATEQKERATAAVTALSTVDTYESEEDIPF